MKKGHALFYLILAFVFAQFAWMGLLGLWIYWYVSNYLIFEQVGDKLSPQIIINSPNVFIFVGGIILIVGIAVAMFFIFRHLTVQIKLNNLYDNFIANITHELKSPLSAIQLYLETMSTKDVKPEKQKEFLSMMTKDANRLKKLINSILEISRLEQKKIAHDFHVYDSDAVVHSLINNSIEHFRLPISSVRFTSNGSCKCLIDKDAMQIVFDNLIDNTIKYSVGTALIYVNLYCENKKIVIEFKDTGIGITPKDQKKIFNKFHRVNNKNIPSVKGTGLGLYWVKEILKFHYGKISVTSEGLNKGSCFKIELPIYSPKKKFPFIRTKRLVKQNITEVING